MKESSSEILVMGVPVLQSFMMLVKFTEKLKKCSDCTLLKPIIISSHVVLGRKLPQCLGFLEQFLC